MRWVEALKLYNDGGIWCIPRKGSPAHAVVKEIMKTGKKPETKSEPKPTPETKAEPTPEITLTESLKKPILQYNKARALKSDYMDGKTTDSSGASKQHEALESFYDLMKKTYNINQSDAFPYLTKWSKEIRNAPAVSKETKKPVEQPKPEEAPKGSPKEGKKATKRQRLMELINTMLSSNSKRDFAKVRQEFEKEFPEFANNATLDAIFSGKDKDFYPTPTKCITEVPEVVRAIKRAEKILEPTAGLGAIVDAVETINKKAKITANELNADFVPILRKLFPSVKVTQENFMDYPIKNDFDTIICNPPFSFGSNKKIYLSFLFKCLRLLNESKAKGELSLIFICPRFIGDKTDDLFDDLAFFGNTNVIPTLAEHLKDELPVAKTKKVLKAIGGDDVPEKDQDVADKILAEYGFYQGRFLGECKGFGGTNVTAAIYEFILV